MPKTKAVEEGTIIDVGEEDAAIVIHGDGTVAVYLPADGDNVAVSQPSLLATGIGVLLTEEEFINKVQELAIVSMAEIEIEEMV